jgi:hypothetical protein
MASKGLKGTYKSYFLYFLLVYKIAVYLDNTLACGIAL